MSFETVINSPLAQVIFGGLITLAVSWFYYSRAAAGLKTETAKLRHLTTLVLRGLEEAGLVEYNRDGSGEITGIIINVSATALGRATLTMSGELTTDVIRHQPASGPD